MEVMKKKIVIKLCILFALILSISACIIAGQFSGMDMTTEFAMSTTRFEKSYQNYLLKFLKYIENEDYTEAFGMLTENSRNDDFNNDIDFFEQIVTDANIKECMKSNDYSYKELNFEYTDDYIIHSETVTLGQKEICIQIYEYSSFNYKIHLSVIDGEGL